MYAEREQLGAVEVHGLDAALSLSHVRQLFSRVAPVLQTVAALDSESQNGVALVIYASDSAASSAIDLFNGCPLGNALLHVKRADSLPNSLINLLYSLDQARRTWPPTAVAASDPGSRMGRQPPHNPLGLWAAGGPARHGGWRHCLLVPSSLILTFPCLPFPPAALQSR